MKRQRIQRKHGRIRKNLRSKRRKGHTPTISRLKKDLEAQLKLEVIRLYGRDCYTCPQKNLVGANCQLGHVPWPRTELSVACRYHPDFCRIQCFRCNINKGGNGAKAMMRMMEQGIDVNLLWQQNLDAKEREKTNKCGIAWFQKEINHYQPLSEVM